MTIQPASSGSPAPVDSLAAATSERAGLPRIAADEPIWRGLPSTSRIIPRLVRSASTDCQAPTTMPDEEQLSATTSASENLKFR